MTRKPGCRPFKTTLRTKNLSASQVLCHYFQMMENKDRCYVKDRNYLVIRDIIKLAGKQVSMLLRVVKTPIVKTPIDEYRIRHHSERKIFLLSCSQSYLSLWLSKVGRAFGGRAISSAWLHIFQHSSIQQRKSPPTADERHQKMTGDGGHPHHLRTFSFVD